MIDHHIVPLPNATFIKTTLNIECTVRRLGHVKYGKRVKFANILRLYNGSEKSRQKRVGNDFPTMDS